MTDFEVTLVARVPQAGGTPTLTEVDRLVVDNISYTEELNRAGTAALGCPLRSLSEASKERLRDLRSFPSEVWVYRGSDIVWSGEVQTLGMQGQSLQLQCSGLLGYTQRMGVTADLTYSDVDQHLIAKGLVDHWQGLAYGHYGLVTSSITSSGVLRDRTYLRNELHNIGIRLQELGAVSNGFDMHVDPSTRALVLSYPQRGIDLTGSVFLDARNIDSAQVAISVAPDDLVSDVSVTGTSDSTAIYAERANTTLRAAYGRSWGSRTFDGVTALSTLEGHGDAYLAPRGDAMFQPGVSVVPRIGLEAGDVHPGDTVSYSYDAGIGDQTGEFRVAKVMVTVADSGKQRIGMEFV